MTDQDTKLHFERPVAVDIDEEMKRSYLDQKRRQLQAKVQDDVEADGIFTILMGDQVEPHREYIEQNAPNVRNLDV